MHINKLSIPFGPRHNRRDNNELPIGHEIANASLTLRRCSGQIEFERGAQSE